MRQTLLVANIEGLCSRRRSYKVSMLREKMTESGTILAALSETHLNANILDAECSIVGYQLYRADRGFGRSKGGVAMYIRDDIAGCARVVCSGSNGVVEYQMIYLRQFSIVLINVYRPPTAEMNDFSPIIADLKQKLRDLNDFSASVIICGDFNMPRTCFQSGLTLGGSNEERRQAAVMVELRDDLCLSQVINCPSRGDSYLDLLFTNNDQLFGSVVAEDTIMSDHRLIVLQTYIVAPQTVSPRRAFSGFDALNFHSQAVRWSDLEDEMRAVDWVHEFSGKNTEEMYVSFKRILLSTCQKYVPQRKKGNGKKQIPRDRKILMRKRCKWRKKLQVASEPNQIRFLKEKIRDTEQRLRVSHEVEQKRQEDGAIEAIKGNSKFFFDYAKRKAKMRTGIGPLHNGVELEDDPAAMSEILRRQYEAVFTSPLEVISSENEHRMHRSGATIEDVVLQTQDLQRAADSLRSCAAAGPDGIPAILIKKSIGVIEEPLRKIWMESMRTGSIPSELKMGRITPIFKNGDKAAASNYRPVTLTSHCIKLFEKVIVGMITKFMEEHDLYNSGQHGFRAGRSCLSQLLAHQLNIFDQLCEGKDVDVVYLDLKKAFDKVDHGILLHKLRLLGVRGRLLDWITEFLRDRKQYVAVDGAVSAASEVISGVPQGSVLGPLLFLIHIGDLNERVQHCTVTSFADDTRVVKSIKVMEDCGRLQDDLNKIYEWADRNNMFFNGNKFELLRYSVAGDSIPFSYSTPEGLRIAEKMHVTDLGVLMANTAHFSQQISDMANRGRQRVGWILRVFKTRDPMPMLTLYRALVLPIVEYCCQLWHPQAFGMIRQLEAVQRTFTYRIVGMRDLSYWQRLERLKLYSLERRRERYIIMYVWKVLQGLTPNFDGENYMRTNESVRRGRVCVLPAARRGAMQRLQTMHEGSVPVLGARLFNCLPRELREYDGTLETFKSRVDRFLATIPDQPCLPHYYQSAASNSIISQLEQMRAERAHILV